MNKISLKKDKLTVAFYIFLIFSLFFLFSGIYSAYSFANLIHQKDQILSENPVEVEFSYALHNRSYSMTLKVYIKNEGPMALWITKISWLTFLVNTTDGHMYQANDYSFYSSNGIQVTSHEEKIIKIVDNSSVKQWISYVYPHLIWEKRNVGKTNWTVELSIMGRVGSSQGNEYQFNYRTWYLWKLPEVEIQYEGNFILN